MVPRRSILAALPESVEELAAHVCRELGIEDLPKGLGMHLSVDQFYAGALYPPNLPGVRACVSESRRWLKAHPKSAVRVRQRRKPRVGSSIAAILGERAMARATLQSELSIEHARSQSAWKRIREELQLEGSLTDSEAATVFESHATRCLPTDYFQAKNIPIVGHTTRFQNEDGSPATYWHPGVSLHIEWPDGGSHVVPYREDWYAGSQRFWQSIEVPDQQGTTFRRSVFLGSLLDHVRDASESLAQSCGWSVRQAVWFCVANTLLDDMPVRVRYRAGSAGEMAYGRITLEIDSWTPAGAVNAIYRKIQHEAFKRPVRPPSQRMLTLYRFLSRAIGDEVDVQTWNALMDLWNQSTNRPKYRNHRSFRRAYQSVATWFVREIEAPDFKVFRQSPYLNARREWALDRLSEHRKPARRRSKFKRRLEGSRSQR